jgi:hypothetical protein
VVGRRIARAEEEVTVIDRRGFLGFCTGAGLSVVMPAAGWAEVEEAIPDVFPALPQPRKLLAVPMAPDLPLDERLLVTTLQGLVNRTRPRMYVVQDKIDAHWLEYYNDRYGITHDTMESLDRAIADFAPTTEGYIVYDDAMLDSANVATSMSGVWNVLPVSERLAPRMRDLGLKEYDNFVGRWKNRYEAYRWALEHVFPHCSPNLLGAVCVDLPHWPSDSNFHYDYLAAQRMFTFDLSARVRDREDVALFHEICERTTGPGCIMGWRCTRCPEHEFVALAARHNLGVLCCLSTRNLTVHASIPNADKPYRQKHRGPSEVRKVENKTYISFINTDGDATWSMLQGHSGRVLDPEYGTLPYTWGILPYAWDLMPGVLQFIYEKKTKNDYFVAASAGALYTYPHLLPDPRAYLRLTRHYMDKTGLNIPYFTNWDDDHWWQEVELPSFVELAREAMPDTLGFVRGMGESAFERDFLDGGAPYIYCGEGIHRDSDVYQTLKDFIDANSIRPLFICCINNHSVKLDEYTKAMKKLSSDVELVNLDELMSMIQVAHTNGQVTGEDLYPEKTELKKLLQIEARAAWPSVRDGILDRAERARLSEQEFVRQKDDPVVSLILERSSTPPADIVAFDAVYDAMALTKAALNLKGIYVNEKAKGARDFLDVFGDLPDAGLIRELWELWLHWHETPMPYEKGAGYAIRTGELAKSIAL